MLNSGAGQLRSIIERVERLEADKAEIAADIRDVLGEAKAMGFAPKIVRRVIKLRKQSAEERAEEHAMTELYMTTIGMTPPGGALSDETRRFAAAKPADDKPSESEPAANPLNGAISDDDRETARKAGAEAAQNGVPITDNPYLSNDPRRATWDEAWCQSAGSDGMDPPEWLQRRKPPKDEQGAEDDQPKADDGAPPAGRRTTGSNPADEKAPSKKVRRKKPASKKPASEKPVYKNPAPKRATPKKPAPKKPAPKGDGGKPEAA